MKKQILTLALCSVLGVACMGLTACGGSGSADAPEAPAAAADANDQKDDAAVPAADADAKKDAATAAAADADSLYTSSNPAGLWTVSATSSDGGTTLTPDGKSTLAVSADGTAALTDSNGTTNMTWEADEYDGEGYYYYFTQSDGTIFVGYIFDEDPNLLALANSAETSEFMALAR